VFDALHKLTTSALRELAASLREGALSAGVNAHAVHQIAGASVTPDLVQCLSQLIAKGWSPIQVGCVADAIAAARGEASNLELQFDLVLSGPDIPGIPTRDTAAVMHSLIEEAQQEVLLVGYAIHNARSLFERLAKKMVHQPDLKVWFCLNIARKPKDTSLSSEIVRRYAHEFRTKHWPWEPLPEVYYDPRSLELEAVTKTSLHAKCLIVDRKVALVTSANFTEAAQHRNIEAGIIIKHGPIIERLAIYFESLRQTVLKHCPLQTQAGIKDSG